jgi:hypothetical protein
MLKILDIVVLVWNAWCEIAGYIGAGLWSLLVVKMVGLPPAKGTLEEEEEGESKIRHQVSDRQAWFIVLGWPIYWAIGISYLVGWAVFQILKGLKSVIVGTLRELRYVIKYVASSEDKKK